jgi:hypothetical protein
MSTFGYHPFLLCAIALQSIKLELPPFFYFARLHCNLLNGSYLPFTKVVSRKSRHKCTPKSYDHFTNS